MAPKGSGGAGILSQYPRGHCDKCLNAVIVQVKSFQKGLLRRLDGIAATTTLIEVDDSRNLARNRQEDRVAEV